MSKNRHHTEQLPASLSIQALEEVVRTCQRNEQRLHELERHTRHERKKAERLLREAYQAKQEREKPTKIKQPPVEFFVSFDDDDYDQTPPPPPPPPAPKPHRVRFNLPKKTVNQEEELADLSRRCENLLRHLHTDQNETLNLKDDQSITLQQALEMFRPEFISHSRERLQHMNNLRDERYSDPEPTTYQEMKQSSKKKYEQLPEVTDRLQRELRAQIRRRNSIRAKIFRVRLRQHVLLHGQTNIDESLTMIDT